MGTKVRQALGSGRPREGRGWCGGEGLGRPRVWGWGRSAEGEGGGKGRKRKTEKRKIELDEVDVGTTAQHGTKDLSSSWDECLDNFLSEDPNTGTPWFWRPVLRRNGGSMSPLRKKEQDYSHCCSSSTATGSLWVWSAAGETTCLCSCLARVKGRHPTVFGRAVVGDRATTRR